MNEQRPNTTTKAEPIDKKDQQPVGHGDKLEDAVERVANKAQDTKTAEQLKGDEVME
jgi:hypothetical protein